VPHNEIDKVDKGGLDKMTLIEVKASILSGYVACFLLDNNSELICCV
jgi:hypothetical protein